MSPAEREQKLQLQYPPTFALLSLVQAFESDSAAHSTYLFIKKRASSSSPTSGCLLLASFLRSCSFITFCVFSNVLFLDIQAEEFSFLRYFFSFFLLSFVRCVFASLSTSTARRRLLLRPTTRLCAVLEILVFAMAKKTSHFSTSPLPTFFLI